MIKTTINRICTEKNEIVERSPNLDNKDLDKNLNQES